MSTEAESGKAGALFEEDVEDGVVGILAADLTDFAEALADKMGVGFTASQPDQVPAAVLDEIAFAAASALGAVGHGVFFYVLAHGRVAEALEESVVAAFAGPGRQQRF